MSDISELKFDKKNFNKHTPEGMGLLEKSLQQFGAGRSILVHQRTAQVWWEQELSSIPKHGRDIQKGGI